MNPPRRRRNRSAGGFVRYLRLVSLIFLTPAALSVYAWSARLTSSRAVGVAFAFSLAAFVVIGIGPRVRAGFDDRPRPAWVGALGMPLFDWVWTAAVFSLLTTLLVLVGTALLALAGHAPTRAFTWDAIAERATIFSAIVAAYGVFVRRRWVRVRRLDVPIQALPASFDGFTIAHLSDLHIGSIDREKSARRWIERTNALGVDLVAITGDVLSTGPHFHDEVVDVLGDLRAPSGIFACLGNHDYYEEDSLCARLLEKNVRVLRNEGTSLVREGDRLFVAGVEDLWRGHVDLDAALVGRDGAPTILLAHHPTLFPQARSRDVDLTLSGHTHAGQVAIPFLEGGLARLGTRYAGGLFREGNSILFVHAGLGTTGPAIRIGAAPEIVVLRLRRASS